MVFSVGKTSFCEGVLSRGEKLMEDFVINVTINKVYHDNFQIFVPLNI